MSEFKREERFIVIKRKNLRPIDERELHTWLQQNDIQTCECVVVESDWPEYEQVWSMIEARVTGSQSALAAKDARIAELEGVLAKALSFTEANTFGGTDALALIEECHAAIAGQQQSETATHSEDGREVIERYALGGHCDSFGQDCGAEMERCGAGEYMTVAQHSRIVAAKDAEIARLRDLNEHQRETIAAFGDELQELKADREPSEEFCDWWEGPEVRRLIGDSAPAIIWAERGWNAAISAQPARQVGGDEKKSPAEKFFGSTKLIGPYASTVEDGVVRRYFMDLCEACDALETAHVLVCMECDRKQRAALAPAAVVMPCRADERQSERYMNGWNSALDEVARLNRRAIPAGLLERVCAIAECEGQPEGDELRALLGKDGE